MTLPLKAHLDTVQHAIRYPRILRELAGGIWCIQPSAHSALVTALESYAAGRIAATAGAAPKAMEDGDDTNGASPKASRFHFTTKEGIAVVPVNGVLGHHLTGMEMLCGGGYDVANLGAVAEDLGDDAAVKAVIFAFDSPGGSVSGIPEVAKSIARLGDKKVTVAWTDSLMASGAYWLAAACGQVATTPSAVVGSIGVYSALVDESAAWAMEGYKLVLAKAGSQKADGIPGAPIEGATIERVQKRVNETYDLFTTWVRERRGNVDDETMQGQTFSGAEAKDRGLVDNTFDTFGELLADVTELLAIIET
jgi:signal peptide peptidase SppA